MRILRSLSPSLLIAGAAIVNAASSSWGFSEAIVSVHGKGVGGGFKDKSAPITISESLRGFRSASATGLDIFNLLTCCLLFRLSDHAPLSKPIVLGSDDLKIVLTAVEGKTPKRPHQALLLVKDVETGLETSFPFTVKDNGKGKVNLAQKDLPPQFLATTKPLQVTLLLGSFGPSAAFSNHVFNLDLALDPSVPISTVENPLRYGKLKEIHHIFRSDPKSPPVIITLIFLAAATACLPALFISWLSLGANIDHLSNALKSSPISHILFFGSILALEGIFFLYYTTWNLLQTLPAVAAVGLISFLSGSRALTEVQERRLAGLR